MNSNIRFVLSKITVYSLIDFVIFETKILKKFLAESSKENNKELSVLPVNLCIKNLKFILF